jgi:hypothetical protein
MRLASRPRAVFSTHPYYGETKAHRHGRVPRAALESCGFKEKSAEHGTMQEPR